LGRGVEIHHIRIKVAAREFIEPFIDYRSAVTGDEADCETVSEVGSAACCCSRGRWVAETVMRIRWRRLVAKSWLASHWHYRRHGLVLAGRPSDKIWYFAYGSNMDEGTFVRRRRIRPLESRVGRIAGYRLRFNLDGRPRGKAAPANISSDADQEVWGVLYKITRRDLLRLDSTEGVPGRGYRPTWLTAEDVDGNLVTAVAYVATGKETDGHPSLRYISLLREGAKYHGLPDHWIRLLDGVKHAE
jgi:cation transport regulator ChaC